MSAISAARNTATMGKGGVPVLNNYPVYQSTIIYEGTLVSLNSSGYLVEATAAATTDHVVGMALATVDNSSGASGALYCNVFQGVARWSNGASITLSSVGALAYVVDNQTVTTSAAGSAPVVGTIFSVDSQGVWVFSGLASSVDGTALTTFITNLASTTTAEGASLVGVEDSGLLLTAADVEAALAEIVKKANAANGVPLSLTIPLASIVTATTTLATWLPGTAGKILRIDACAVSAPTTADKAITFTAAISGVGTSATLAVTTTTLATTGTRVSGVVATAASYTASQAISIKPSSVTTFTEGMVLLTMYLQSA